MVVLNSRKLGIGQKSYGFQKFCPLKSTLQYALSEKTHLNALVIYNDAVSYSNISAYSQF